MTLVSYPHPQFLQIMEIIFTAITLLLKGAQKNRREETDMKVKSKQKEEQKQELEAQPLLHWCEELNPRGAMNHTMCQPDNTSRYRRGNRGAAPQKTCQQRRGTWQQQLMGKEEVKMLSLASFKISIS